MATGGKHGNVLHLVAATNEPATLNPPPRSPSSTGSELPLYTDRSQRRQHGWSLGGMQWAALPLLLFALLVWGVGRPAVAQQQVG